MTACDIKVTRSASLSVLPARPEPSIATNFGKGRDDDVQGSILHSPLRDKGYTNLEWNNNSLKLEEQGGVVAALSLVV